MHTLVAYLTLILLTGENGQLFEVLVTSGGGAGKMKVLVVELVHLLIEHGGWPGGMGTCGWVVIQMTGKWR